MIRTNEDALPIGMFTGYYENPELTKTVWDKGIYHTGDTAWRDEWGYYWYVGRADDAGLRIAQDSISRLHARLTPAGDEVLVQASRRMERTVRDADTVARVGGDEFAVILADLGLGKLRVLGTPRRQVGLAGFGLEIVEYAALPAR